jgi:hypothetical protein
LHGDFYESNLQVKNQERTTKFSFSGSPSVIERLGVDMAGAAASYFMSSDLPEGALAPINPERRREWATSPDDDVMAASIKIGGDDPSDYLVLGLVVNYSLRHVHVAFPHELSEICVIFEDDFEFDGVADLNPRPASLH